MANLQRSKGHVEPFVDELKGTEKRTPKGRGRLNGVLLRIESLRVTLDGLLIGTVEEHEE